MNLVIVSVIVSFLGATAFGDVNPKQAKAAAIEFAQADVDGNYFGEESPQDATRVLRTQMELRLFNILLAEARTTSSGSQINNERLKKQMEADEEFLWPHEDGAWHIVTIEYVDCDSHTNFIAVDKKTGKVWYLFSATDSL